MAALDALIYSGLQVAAVTGIWANATAYNIGNRVVDPDGATIYTCLVPHTSAALGTFSADRLLHPTYWVAATASLTARGAWQQNTVYNANDITYQVSEGVSAICSVSHTSTAVGTIRTDAANWIFIIDLSSGTINADDVAYDNATSLLVATQAQAAIDEVVAALLLKAPLASPTFTGSPRAPTAATSDASTLLATTAFVAAAIAAFGVLVNKTCRVATTGNVVIASALNNGDTIDGVVLATSDRVLVKSQTDPKENGIYIVDAVPFRATDSDLWSELVNTIVNVTAGTVNANLSFRATINAGGTIGVDDITYTQFGGAVTLPLSIPNGGSGAVTAAAARTAYGLVIGTDVQAQNARLADIAGLAWANGDVMYFDTTLKRLPKGSNGQYLSLAAGLPAWASAAGGIPDIILEDQKAQDIDGGTFSSGGDRTRDLNTEVRDALGICSILANQFTISAAGTYYIEWQAPAVNSTYHQSMLYDVTGGVVMKRGCSEYANPNSISNGVHVFAIAGANIFEIRHRCALTTATNGFGIASNYGVEVYTRVKIWKSA